MSKLPERLEDVDWRTTTWDGARREQLLRWAELPLDRIILSLQEMAELTAAFESPAVVRESEPEWEPS